MRRFVPVLRLFATGFLAGLMLVGAALISGVQAAPDMPDTMNGWISIPS